MTYHICLLILDTSTQTRLSSLFTFKLHTVESASLALMFYLRYYNVATIALFLTFCFYHIRYSFLDGEMNLWTLKAKHDLYLVEMMKYNKSAAKNAILDSINIHLIMGLPCNAFAIFE